MVKRILYFSFALIALSACGPKKELTATEQHRELKKRGVVFEHEDSKKKKAEEQAVKNIPNQAPIYGYAIRNKTLYTFVKDWEGTPYRYGGNSQEGVDCSGFVCQAYTEVYNLPFISRRAEDMFKEVKPISKANLQEGDLVFFKINGRRIDHVGVYLNDGKFAHTSSSKGVMVSNLNEDYYLKRFHKGGRKES